MNTKVFFLIPKKYKMEYLRHMGKLVRPNPTSRRPYRLRGSCRLPAPKSDGEGFPGAHDRSASLTIRSRTAREAKTDADEHDRRCSSSPDARCWAAPSRRPRRRLWAWTALARATPTAGSPHSTFRPACPCGALRRVQAAAGVEVDDFDGVRAAL